MKFIQKTNDRVVINLFGIKMKFRKPVSQELLIKNLLYELADKRTLENIKLPKVLGLYESTDFAISSGKSFARYGDGEFKLMMGESINFQKANPELSKRLTEIISNKNPNLLVGLPDVFGYCNSDYFRCVMINCREFLYNYIDFESTYIDSMFTRQRSFVTEQIGIDYFSRLKNLWNNKDVIIVEGEGSRLGIGNDLFANTKSIKRILCPIKDAFDKYNEILNECNKQSKDIIFIIALGPTATVLADDLSKLGYKAFDVGHIDACYEWFLRKANENIPVEGKILLNSERKRSKIPQCKDPKYYEQIIAKIL